MTDPNNSQHDPNAWSAPESGHGATAPGSWPQPPAAEQPPAAPPQWQQPAQPGQPGEGQWAQPAGQVPPPAPPYGAPGYPMAAPPKKRRTGRIIGIVAAVVVVLIAVVAIATTVVNKHSDKLAKQHTLTVPAKAGDYVQLTNSTANQVGDSILSAVKDADAESVWSNPKVGVYAKSANGDPEVILLGLNVADSKELTREMGTNSIAEEAKVILKSAGLSSAQSYDAGKFGGELRCGTLDSGGTPLATCIWIDHSTVGVVYQINGQPSDTAAVAKTIREAGEK